MSGTETTLRVLWGAAVNGEVRYADGDDPDRPQDGFLLETAKAKAKELYEAGEGDVEIVVRKVYFDGAGEPVRFSGWSEVYRVKTWPEAITEIDALWIED